MQLCSQRLAQFAATQLRSGCAHAALAEAARRTNVEQVEREYFDLFIGLGRGELLPYGSYYLTGFLHERPLARLRAHLAQARHRTRGGKPSRRITRRSCARSWPGSTAGAFLRRRRGPRVLRAASGALDRALLRRSGRGAGTRISTAASERSAGCSWRSRRRLSRCRRERDAGDGDRNEGGDGDETRTTRRPLGRREFLRALGAGATAAAAAAGPLAADARADSESNDEKRKARYQAKLERGADLLSGQPVSELRRQPC